MWNKNSSPSIKALGPDGLSAVFPMIQFAVSIPFMMPLLKIIVGVRNTLSKATVNLFLDFRAWKESRNRSACPLIITFNCMGCIQNTSDSGLNSVSHMAAGCGKAVPLALPAPVAHVPPREGSPSLWTWQGCTAPPQQITQVMSPLKIKMCVNWVSVCVCRWNTPNCLVSICPNWSGYTRWSSARLNSYWGITKRLDRKQEPDWEEI